MNFGKRQHIPAPQRMWTEEDQFKVANIFLGLLACIAFGFMMAIITRPLWS